MALDDILSAIRRDAKAEAAEIRREAKKRTRAIEAQAAERAEALTTTVAEQAERRATRAARAVARDVEQQLRATRLTAERERSKAIFAALEEELARLRDDPAQHRRVTTRLVQQALEALPEASVLRHDPRDQSLVEAIAESRSLTLEPSLTTWGGVVVSEGDGRRRVDNTLEARLGARYDELLLLAAQVLLPSAEEGMAP